MQRRIYRAVLKSDKVPEGINKLKQAQQKLSEMADSGEIENPCLFKFNNQVFLYFEFCKDEVSPEDIFEEATDYLELWPSFEGNRRWALMHDIFHYQSVQSDEDWRRKTKVELQWGRVIRLKPDMIASYIFYHYQYQEEKPGDGDKYGIIGIHEDLLFFYCEKPTVIEKPTYKGLLNTVNTPSNWGELMHKHFKDWLDVDNYEDTWRETEIILSLL